VDLSTTQIEELTSSFLIEEEALLASCVPEFDFEGICPLINETPSKISTIRSAHRQGGTPGLQHILTNVKPNHENLK
jgi:hypothetical protein